MVVQPQSNQQPTEVLNNVWGYQWQQARAGEIYPSVTIQAIKLGVSMDSRQKKRVIINSRGIQQ